MLNPTAPVILRKSEYDAVLAAIATIPSSAYVEVLVNYNILVTDGTVNVKNPVSVTLPTAVGITGKVFTVKNTSDGTVTILTTASQLIDDDTLVKIWIRNTSLNLQSTGSGWIIT